MPRSSAGVRALPQLYPDRALTYHLDALAGSGDDLDHHIEDRVAMPSNAQAGPYSIRQGRNGPSRGTDHGGPRIRPRLGAVRCF